MDHFRHPRGAGTLPPPCLEGWSGDVATHRYMRIQVCVENNRVTAATFGTFGCAAAIASGSCLCEWVTGRAVSEAHTLTPDQLDGFLGGLPRHRLFCATLAVDALRAALSHALEVSP
jgi:NifU-like protein involved in Fe-S cluster formation